MRATILLIITFLIVFPGFSQDSLVLRNNKRIPYSRLAMFNGEVEIKNAETKAFEIYPCDSVYGYSEGMKERTYFLKKNPETDEKSHLFLSRLEVGNVSIFEGTGNNQSLYAEKDGRLEKILSVTDSKSLKAERLEVFKSFVQDDDESLSYIASSSFKLRWKDIITVAQYYNKRNFRERTPSPNDVLGAVYLYRTQFQKTKEGIKIRLNGKSHDLYIEDYIILDLPVDYASMLSLRDSEVKNTHVISGELEEQFFEVLYDSKTNTFRFDKKGGTELQFEFYKIKDKVGKKISHD